MTTGLERVFGQWEDLSARNLAGHHILTVEVAVSSDHSTGTSRRLSDAQEQRLIDLLLADIAQLKK